MVRYRQESCGFIEKYTLNPCLHFIPGDTFFLNSLSGSTVPPGVNNPGHIRIMRLSLIVSVILTLPMPGQF
jgi:hypothetical protein